MSDHISETISESEQMYLITIARSLEDGGPDPLPLSHIAKKLSLQPVSVNQMVRKLEGEGLVHYHPYKGVELTDRGQVIASRTLRNRRLWQLFLVDQLQVSLEEADAMACDLEHITPDDIAQRLSSYLDEPAVGPGGHPIPALNGDHIKPSAIPLSQIDVGMSARVEVVKARSEIARFLYSEGVRPGTEIYLVGIGSRGNRLLKIGQDFVDISLDIVESIQVHQSPLSTAG